jgi:putative zinc finger protein
MLDEPLTCQELVELVTDYFENVLGPADRARFEAHVAECPGCDIYLRQMQTTLKLVGATAGLETGPEVSALLDAFRDWRRSGA